MPILSMFYGVIIRMQSEKAGNIMSLIFTVFSEMMKL